MFHEAQQFLTAGGLTIRDISINESPTLPQGYAEVPIISRPDLDYTNASRLEITGLNTELVNAEYRFWGNPDGFPYGTFEIAPVEIQDDGERNITIRQPAPYFPEAVLVLATNRPAPSLEELLKARDAQERIDTVHFNQLHGAKEIFVAHLLGAFGAAVEISQTNPHDIHPVGIVHHTPVTGEWEGVRYPRSAGDLHGTVGIIRRSNVLPVVPQSPDLDAELNVMRPEVLFDLHRQMRGNLADQGFGSDLLSITPRRNPSGLGIRFLGLDASYLTTREGIQHATAVMDAVSQVYPQVHHDVFKHAASPIPAHRQVMSMNGGEFMYNLAPIPFGNQHGGGEASGYWPDRSTKYQYTPEQHQAIDVFNTKATLFIATGVRNLRGGR